MKKSSREAQNLLDSKLVFITHHEKSLLKWMEIIIAAVCLLVLIYLIFFSPPNTHNRLDYSMLLAVVFLFMVFAILLSLQEKYIFSAIVLIVAGTIGPWWSALVDPSVSNGNLIPLVYITIPILFSSLFAPLIVSILVGTIQIIGLMIFILLGNFNLSMGASSLFFFLIFIFASGLVFNIQNRNNRVIISSQIEMLKEQAIRDPLTGLYNRRFPLEYLEKEIARLKRIDGFLSLIVLDVDDFKTINDTCGHDCGDAILVGISNILIKNFRYSDVICRYGGDEFLIILSENDLLEAQKKAEALQKAIEQKPFKCTCEKEMQVTISIGITGFPKHAESVKDLIKSADLALYKAKEKGKNRIEVGENLG